MKLVPGEQMTVLGRDCQELPLPEFFKGTITDLFTDPSQSVITLAIDNQHVLQIGILDGRRPAPGQPYRMGIRLGAIAPDAPHMPAEPHDAELYALATGKKLDRARVENTGGGIILELAGGQVHIMINASGILVARDPAPPQ